MMIKIVNMIKSVNRRISGVVQILRLKFMYGNHVKFDGFPVCGGKLYVTMFENGQLHIGSKLSVRRNTELRCSGKIWIGNGCFFNNNCSITASEKIEIGDNCIFGENVSIYDQNHRFRNKNQLIKEQGYSVAPVIIGNNVWIGSNVTILKGVTIGDHCVIGANCVIYKDVPNDTIVKNSNALLFSEILYEEEEI